MNFDSHEKYYVYFLCDPTRPLVGKSFGNYTMDFEPYYCGKGTLKRIKSKKSKATQDKTNSLLLKNIEPYYTFIGPFDEELAFLIEEYFVDLIGRRDIKEGGLLLNLQNGGFGGKKPSIESRQKMSNSHKGKKPWNKGLKGAQVAWNKDIPQNEATKLKISNSCIGRDAWNKGLLNPLGEKHHNAKSVIINGVKYPTIRDASKDTGISIYLIKKRYLQ